MPTGGWPQESIPSFVAIGLVFPLVDLIIESNTTTVQWKRRSPQHKSSWPMFLVIILWSFVASTVPLVLSSGSHVSGFPNFLLRLSSTSTRTCTRTRRVSATVAAGKVLLVSTRQLWTDHCDICVS